MSFSFLRVTLILWLVLAIPAVPAVAQDKQPPTLLAELGCANCHTDLALPNTIKPLAPDLGYAGLRYNPAYLFDYLQNPKNVRRHMGRARMPDFHLAADEALALTLFLAEQKEVAGRWPALPEGVISPMDAAAAPMSKAEFEKLAHTELACNACHGLDGVGGGVSIDLSKIGHRLQPGWTKRYLASPEQFGVPASVMPGRLFALAEDRSAYKAQVPDAVAKAERLTRFLFSRGAEKRKQLDAKFSAAKKAAPEIDAARGEVVFRALNCAACHRHPRIAERPGNGPDLTREGERASADWLKGYLKKPHAIRPFGNRPGDGSRMPDFRLTDDEAVELSNDLAARRSGAQPEGYRRATLSAFKMRKAKLLFHDKLPCLGCHQLGEQGGRIGPDLTDLAVRRSPEYVYRMIVDPEATVRHTVMPKYPFPEKTARLITDYLLQRSAKATPRIGTYLSLVKNEVLPLSNGAPARPKDAKHLYASRCAACHGVTGKADGYNAQFLPVKPTLHADKAHMAKRPDDTLFDGIHAGGYILNKSHLMPPWGLSLSTPEIRDLVKFMRTLCGCQGPKWSRDG